MFTLTIENKRTGFVRTIDIWSNLKADARYQRRAFKKMYPWKSYTFKMVEHRPAYRFLEPPKLELDLYKHYIPIETLEPPVCCKTFGHPCPAKHT